MKVCTIPVEDCKGVRCSNCEHQKECDFAWIYNEYKYHLRTHRENCLLSPINAAYSKDAVREGKFISVTGGVDFCEFNVAPRYHRVTIYNLYVAPEARHMGIAKQLINYLLEKYKLPVFAKCVAGTTAQTFFKHIGKEVNPCEIRYRPDGTEKRRLAWYVIMEPIK